MKAKPQEQVNMRKACDNCIQHFEIGDLKENTYEWNHPKLV
jgi:hypothetical protein